jgi:hypothetical protein
MQGATRKLLGADLLQFDPLTPFARITAPDLGIDLDWWSGCKLCLELLWDLRPEVAEEVTALRQGFPTDEPYVGVHLRRGDKRSEAAYVAIGQYAAAIRTAVEIPKRIVVASDDADAPPRLAAELGSQFEVILLSLPGERGHIQGDFNRLSSEARRARTIRFLAEFETLRDSATVFVTLSSNVGCLLQYARGNRALIDVV